MKTEKQKLTERILDTVENIYNMFGPAVPQEWMSSDITVTQLRILLILHTAGSLKMSDIAAKLHVTLPTATVIVSNLVRNSWTDTLGIEPGSVLEIEWYRAASNATGDVFGDYFYKGIGLELICQ